MDWKIKINKKKKPAFEELQSYLAFTGFKSFDNIWTDMTKI